MTIDALFVQLNIIRDTSVGGWSEGAPYIYFSHTDTHTHTHQGIRLFLNQMFLGNVTEKGNILAVTQRLIAFRLIHDSFTLVPMSNVIVAATHEQIGIWKSETSNNQLIFGK